MNDEEHKHADDDKSHKHDDKPQQNVAGKLEEELRKIDPQATQKPTPAPTHAPTTAKKSSKNSAASNDTKAFIVLTSFAVFLVTAFFL
jgi:hypothetical protein